MSEVEKDGQGVSITCFTIDSDNVVVQGLNVGLLRMAESRDRH